MGSSYRKTLENWLGSLNVSAHTVLDIGGSQLPVKDRVKSWNVQKYLIGDIDSPHIGSPFPDVVVDLNTFANTSIKVDMIFCLEVFEYVYDPVNAMHIISSLLEPGGVAYISFPFVYPQHQPLEDDALRYTIRGVEKIAKVAGLKINHYLERKPETNLLSEFISAERLRGAKNINHNVMGWIVKFEK